MPDWINYLTPKERARLEKIDAMRDVLTAERNAMMNRAKQRKHRKAPHTRQR